MKKDIATSQDVQMLVDTFYGKVRRDEVIGYIFEDVVKVDWPSHLPRMYAFWEFLLLDHAHSLGNPLEKHFRVHEREPLRAEHFDRWVALFQESVDELFEGERAGQAKFKAYAIAETWKPKFTGTFGLVR